jgi:hypothetical protein
MFVGFVFSSIALGLKGHIFVTLNPTLTFFLVNDLFKALYIHPIKVILLGFCWICF